MIRFSQGPGAILLALFASAAALAQPPASPALQEPIAIYRHAFAQDGTPAANPLTEKLALRDLDQLDRLKGAGVRIDFDLLDAVSFAPAGGYAIGRSSDWPNGPDAWIARCRAVGIRPGLRFAGNSLGLMQPVPAWKNSLSVDGRALSLFEGGFLTDLTADMQSWYDRGIRLFQFDSLDLTAATPASAGKLTREEIVARNTAALRKALAAFRDKNSDAVLLISAGNANAQAHTSLSSVFVGDGLGVSTIFSTGEPLTSVQPQANFRRSIDVATDDRVRRLEQSGVALRQIDSSGFSAAPDIPGVHAQLPAWKGAFLLSMARGGWVNNIYGNLESIADADAGWMSRVQKLFFSLQEGGRIRSFGGSPGDGQPYGFAGATARGTVAVVVNPGQAAATLDLRAASADQASQGAGRVLFRDAGYVPRLSGDTIKLGPGQMAVVGFGAFAAAAYSFGVQEDVVIPSSIEPIEAAFESTAPGTIEARIDPPIEGVLRVIVLAHDPGGQSSRDLSTTFAGQNTPKPFVLEATQSGRPIPLRMSGSDGSSFVSSGPSWAIAEIDVDDLTPGIPVRVEFQSNEKELPTLEGRAYQVVY